LSESKIITRKETIMNTILLEARVGELVRERPSRAKVFEEFGIDYCCGGRVSLAEACRARGLDLETVADRLAASDAAQGEEPVGVWEGLSLGGLADYIMARHHEYLRSALPRLEGLLEKVEKAHGAKHPEMVEVRRIFAEFHPALMQHMMKEEMALFPMLRQLDDPHGERAFHCGSVGNPIRVMLMEHDEAGAAMERFRTLTQGYTPPEDACNTFRAALHGLAELEEDMHRHVHIENEVLFPRALDAERG
jgi:regulator of cell morphogenesis and NO signaling